MNSHSMLPKSLITFAVLTIPFAATADVLFSEGFNYTAGSNLGGQVNPGNSVTWTGGNAVLAVGNTALSYSGFQSVAGNDLVYTSGTVASTSVNTYNAVSSGSIYYSFLINCTAAPTANNYLSALNAGTTVPGGSGDALSLYVGAMAGGYRIGVRTTGGGSGAVYDATALSLNTTYLVVEELTLGSTSVANLYVLGLGSDTAIPGGTQPGTADATQSTTTAIASVADIGFKAQLAATAGNFEFGSLRVGTTWADVTPTPEPSGLALAGMGIAALGFITRRLRR
jgi:hypothetical protein